MRLTLKLKLGMVFAVLLLMSGISMFIAINRTGQLNEKLNEIVDGNARRMELAQIASTNQARLFINLYRLVNSTAENDVRTAQEEILARRQDVGEAFEELDRLTVSDEGKRRLEAAKAARAEMVQEVDQAISLAKGHQYNEATLLLNGEASVARTKLVEALDAVVQLNKDQMKQAALDGEALYENGRDLLIMLLAGAAIIGTSAAVWIVLSISRSLSSAVGLANAVASGDLNATAEAKGNDEIKDLIDALNLMVAKLKDVVGEVNAASRNVASGSQEMAASSEQLSQGATEQASATEEASSSVEQMAANIKQNADNAGQTEAIARQSAANAEISGKAVAEAVDAMETIAEKILIVQEIARQTDLLALNAAVEAARAGEHGRGFAVVASEVRKLAERSQAAAQEISGLSGGTVKAAQSAGEMLAKLVPDIQKTADLVSEIAAASNEQNAGAAQINAAIQQLDKVTQQNTSAAEEMSSTAEELAAQAEQLQSAISYFRVDQAGEPALRGPVVKVGNNVHAMQDVARKAALGFSGRTAKHSGGFALDMGDGADDADRFFARQNVG